MEIFGIWHVNYFKEKQIMIVFSFLFPLNSLKGEFGKMKTGREGELFI